MQSTFTYDTLNQLTAMNAAKASYSYQLGATGTRKQVTESGGRVVNWSYDGIYRLTNETISLDPHSNNGSVAYGLDPVGNRLSQTSTLSAISSGSYSYDADGRILSTETYDNNGNTLVTGARAFTYDFENRLKTMTMGSTQVSIVYDGDGNRVAKTANGVTTQYLVDRLNPTHLSQVVEELVDGTVVRTYTYGLQRISQNQLINSTWTPSFYGYDAFDSVRLLTDSTGAATDAYDYDAWGNEVNSSGSTANTYLYRGEQYDTDLGLYYLRARYFNPLAGRFLARDPARGDTFLPDTLQKYFYASDDPVNRLDPLGWQSCWGAWTPQAGGYVILVIGPLTFPAPIIRPPLWGDCGGSGGQGGGSQGTAGSGKATGSTKCNPCTEAPDIWGRINRIQKIVNGGGSSGVGGESFCQIAVLSPKQYPPSGGWYPIGIRPDITFDPVKQPCLYQCAEKHEDVHRRQCEYYGPRYGQINDRYPLRLELPAYAAEIGCLLKTLGDGGLPAPGPHAY